MNVGGAYRTSGANQEPEPIEVSELRRKIEQLEGYPNPLNFPGGQRGIACEIDFMCERIEQILAEHQS